MERTDWTLLVYRLDKRCKTGEKLRGRYEYCDKTRANMESEVIDLCRVYPANQFRIELHETYVTRVNMMTGKEYKEHFQTPHCCSPSNETFWSM